MIRRWRLLTALRAALILALGIVAGSATAGHEGGSSHLRSLVSKIDSLKKSGQLAQASVLLDSAVVLARTEGEAGLLGQLMLDKAAMLQTRGESGRALSLLYQTLEDLRGSRDSLALAEVFNSIGTIQHDQKNFAKAEAYYHRSGAIYQKLGLKKETGKYWNNLGSLFDDKGDPGKAIVFHRRSLAVWQGLGNTGWAAVSYMQLGTCYSKLGKTDSARYFLTQSMRDQGLGSTGYLMAVTKVDYGVNENRAGRQGIALRFCKEGLAMAVKQNASMLQQQACDCLYKTYDALGDKGTALDYYRRSVTLRDTLFGEAKVKNLTRIEMDHEFAQKQLADSLTRAKVQVEEELAHQAEVTQEREARNLALYGAFGVLLLAVGLWSRLRNMRLSRTRIQRERERSERLLLNILPATVAQELKDNGKALARDYPEATILFSDFKDFTRISETMSAQALVEELDTCFKAFDRIMDAHGIEKIKTIGDAYMCVGGLPGLTDTVPADVVKAGLEMQVFIAERRIKLEKAGLPFFTMRVGIHTGPVVAGIVGLKKFAFDIWGDAVNTACAMEHSGEEGKVNISQATYALVKDVVANGPDGSLATDKGQQTTKKAFNFTPRGKVEAKGKGGMEMYFVERA